MTFDQAEKAAREIGGKLATKEAELLASIKAIADYRQRYALIPWTWKMRREISSMEKQQARRIKKRDKLAVELLQADQVRDECQRLDVANKQTDLQIAVDRIAGELQPLVRHLASEGALDELSMRPGERGMFLYLWGPENARIYQQAVDQLEAYGQATGRPLDADRLCTQTDVKELLLWAQNAAGSPVSDEDGDGEESATDEAESQQIEGENADEESIQIEGDGDAVAGDAGEPVDAEVEATGDDGR